MTDLIPRLAAATHSERIGLFLCTTEGDRGESGFAVNERHERFFWWLELGGQLDVEPMEEFGVLLAENKEYLAALAKVS